MATVQETAGAIVEAFLGNQQLPNAATTSGEKAGQYIAALYKEVAGAVQAVQRM